MVILTGEHLSWEEKHIHPYFTMHGRNITLLCLEEILLYSIAIIVASKKYYIKGCVISFLLLSIIWTMLGSSFLSFVYTTQLPKNSYIVKSYGAPFYFLVIDRVDIHFPMAFPSYTEGFSTLNLVPRFYFLLLEIILFIITVKTAPLLV